MQKRHVLNACGRESIGFRRQDARKNSTETENVLVKNVLQIIVILKHGYVLSSTLAGIKDDARQRVQ